MSRKHTFDQHFLRSPKLVAELVGHSNIRKNDIVYDLGAGSGVIASVLANKCKYVVAVEIEPQALSKLQQNLGNVENVEIVKDDFTKLKFTDNNYKIFANIPFSLSADAVRKFTSSQHPPKSMYLIVQKQFARKLVPGSDHFTSQLGAEIAPWFTARIRRPLRRTDFTPPPNVDTVLLEIKPREAALIDKKLADDYRRFVTKSFQDQRFFASLPLAEAKISSELRPSQLVPEQWRDLYFKALGV